MSNPYEPPSVNTEPTRGAIGSTMFDPIADKAIQDSAGKAVMFSVGGLLCCAPLAFAGISQGNTALRTIRMTGAGQAYRTNALGAVVIGYIAIVVWVIGFFVKIARL